MPSWLRRLNGNWMLVSLEEWVKAECWCHFLLFPQGIRCSPFQGKSHFPHCLLSHKRSTSRCSFIPILFDKHTSGLLSKMRLFTVTSQVFATSKSTRIFRRLTTAWLSSQLHVTALMIGLVTGSFYSVSKRRLFTSEALEVDYAYYLSGNSVNEPIKTWLRYRFGC